MIFLGLSALRSAQSVSGLRRRQFAIGALALPAIIGQARAAPARNVTFAGYGDWFQANFDARVLGAFRKAHPEIRVFYYPVGNSYQSLTMLRSQRALPSIDIALLDSGVAAGATAEGLVETLDADSLPVMKDLIPQARLKGVGGPALMLDNLALGYNPGLVAAPPRTWRALWDPVYGRRVALQTPPDPLGLAMTAVAAGLYGGGDPKTSLDIALTALGQLAPRVAVWDPIPDVYTAIAVGDAALGPCWNARGQAQAAMTPGRFATMMPDDGSPYLTTTVNLIKGTPQPEAARTLIAWLLGPEAQRLLVEAMFYAPVNAKADIPPALLTRVGATEAVAARRMELDWAAVTASRDGITAAWRTHDLAAR